VVEVAQHQVLGAREQGGLNGHLPVSFDPAVVDKAFIAFAYPAGRGPVRGSTGHAEVADVLVEGAGEELVCLGEGSQASPARSVVWGS
jgi:hypothetical protein